MALDSKQKRGSALDLTMPFRSWLSEPDGTIAATDRQSFVKLCTAVAFSAPGGGIVGSLFRPAIFISRILRGAL